MSETECIDEPLKVHASFGPFQRTLFIAAGLFCITVPAWELRAAFLQPGWWSIFFGIIILGAWSVGFSMLGAGVAGDDLRWVFNSDGSLTLHRRSLLRQRTDQVRGDDVLDLSIRTIAWDSRADSYCVVMRTKNGERFETTDRNSMAGAEALRVAISRHLRIAA